MSRRESRSSLGGRQTTALEEFENFKKKYLLVNKHIAKLNSSLNVRIEELLSQIAALNIDNLRLRASEMSLARKLENEQDRTRRLYRETESASQLLVSQISSMKVMFGLDKPPTQNILRDHNSASRQKTARQPHPPPSCRIAQAPEFEAIAEVSEGGHTPTKVVPSRESPSPTPGPATPLNRRRSTGSTPHSTPASNFSPSPGGSTPITTAKRRKSDEERRFSTPSSMDIANSSSSLTPSPLSSVAGQAVLASPSPASNARTEQVATSPSDRERVTEAEGGDRRFTRNSGDTGPTSSYSFPQLNLTGLKRVARSRHSGLLTEDARKDIHPAVSVSIPPTSASSSGAPAYPTPLSAEPAPSTPPKASSSIRFPDFSLPTTPTRTLPMSPSLSANPALSPPPARKLSLTRRQLDFGIPDPEEAENEDLGAEIDAADPEAEGLLSFQNDSVVGRRAMKRKGVEDEDGEEPIMLSSANKPQGVRPRRQEKRRDTGVVLTSLSLQEKNATEALSQERGSKESLRDVTNEGPSQSFVESKLQDPSDATLPMQRVQKGHFSSGTVAGIAAKLEKISSTTRPKPLSAPTPLPLPSPDTDTKIPLAEEEPPGEAPPDVAAAELGRRNSGRQRKSVNYKEPSLNTKMRKPDPIPSSTMTFSATLSSTVGGSTGSVLTAGTNVVPRPPKRKKGSISLIGEMAAAASTSVNSGGSLHAASTSSTDPPTTSRKSSKLDLLEPTARSEQLQPNQKRASLLWENCIDLSDEEERNTESGEKNSPTAPKAEPGGSYFSSETGSRYSFAGLTGLRATSILAKGPNPIVVSSAANPIVRSTASLRVTPGAARERVREELAGGASAKREREKERERERERDREREQEGGRDTNGIVT